MTLAEIEPTDFHYNEVMKEQKRICEAEISKDFPSRNTIFDCACKLQTLKAYDGAIDYFLALSHKGYRTQEAYLHIAECYFMKKDYISSTSYIRDCLDMDETYEPAREFNSRLKEVVKQDGTIFLKGLGIAALLFVGIFTVRRMSR